MALILLLIALIAPTCYPADLAVSEFGGLNNNDNSLVIANKEAQDLLNVDITPGGKSVKKRPGFGTYKDFNNGQTVHGGHHFFDSAGADVQVWGSSRTLYGIVSDATPNVIVTSATVNATWDCADTQGFAYCVNTGRDAFIKTNGTTLTGWYTSPLGTMIETTPDRVVVAGVSGNPNTLYFSQSAVFTNFTTGINAVDPFTEVIASPGSKLTHIRYACGKLLWWKDQSFGYLNGDDQTNVSPIIVSDVIGTYDNTSSVDPGGSVWFRGSDSAIWKYDCSALSKQSIEITPSMQSSGKRTSNYWTQTTKSDFGSGYFLNTTSTSVDGSVVITKFSESFSSLSNWTTTQVSVWDKTPVSFKIDSNSVFSDTSTAVDSSADMYSSSSNITANNFNLYFEFKTIGSACSQECYVIVSTGTDSRGGYGININSTYQAPNCFQRAYIVGPDLANLTGYTSYSMDTSTHSLYLSRNDSGVMALYFDGVSTATLTDTTYSSFSGMRITCRSAYPNLNVVRVSNLNLSPSTATYYSQVKNSPNLTSWDIFTANKQDDGGAHTFYVRSSTGAFTVLSSTPLWTAQTLSGQVNYSTGTYLQMRDDFSITSATQSPTLNDFTFNWYEGSAGDQAYSEYFDNSIWFSLPYGAGQSVNNRIFRYDLINQAWTQYDFGAGGFAIQNNEIYFGSPLSSIVYKYGSGTTDAGSAISSYWKSKDFPATDPWLESQYNNIDTIFKRDPSQSVTVGYTFDASTTTVNYSVSTSDTLKGIIRHKKNLPGTYGGTINLKFSDNTNSSNWELLGFRIKYEPQPYRPTR